MSILEAEVARCSFDITSVPDCGVIAVTTPPVASRSLPQLPLRSLPDGARAAVIAAARDGVQDVRPRLLAEMEKLAGGRLTRPSHGQSVEKATGPADC